MTVRYTEYPAQKTVEFTVQGYVTRADYYEVLEPLQRFIDRHGRIRMIKVIESLDGFDPSVLLTGIRFDIRKIRHISHLAVVSDLGWISPLVKAAGALVSTKVRMFQLDQLDEARAWVGQAGLIPA
jgi:hypothetical protein